MSQENDQRHSPLSVTDEKADPSNGNSAVRDVHELESTFLALADDWRVATSVFSSTSAKVESPFYQEIIQLGWSVVPLILRELRRKPEHWFHALSAITGENPIPSEDLGDMREMADAWLKWGESRGYV